MEDDELQAIRARRMAELQAQAGAVPGGASPIAGSSGRPAQGDDDDKKGQIEEMRRTMHCQLYQILDNSARERLARINMVKADKARAVEDLLIRLAQSNQLRGKVSEQQLIDLLGKINQQEPSASQTKIVYNRRRFDDDSDDEYDL
ncbi:hypothetical protein VTP01DRAFT_6422 [Rhizomucor pusillus]|uniref:uncharacterized protein n=1 Tax=Rhizomucor pusillus TaxID=4840 RepID=UPI0037432FF4